MFDITPNEVDYNVIYKNQGALKIDDIEGARPKVFGSGHWHKPVEEIEGASPRKLHGRYKVPHRILNIEDIEGTQPDAIKFPTNRRTLN